MAQHALRKAGWLLAGLAFLAGGQAWACDSHDDPAANKYLAYLELRGLSDTEVRALEQQAIDKYHEKQLAVARARFLRRFQPDPAPPVQDVRSSVLPGAESTSL